MMLVKGKILVFLEKSVKKYIRKTSNFHILRKYIAVIIEVYWQVDYDQA